jgi:hypothetical protein
MLAQLKDLAKTTLTERGRKIMDINELENKRNSLYDELLQNELGDTSQMNWNDYEDFLMQKNDFNLLTQKIDLKFGNGKKTEASILLDELEIETTNDVDSIHKKEMNDYITFKRYMLSVTNEEGVLTQWDSVQKSTLLQMKNAMEGKAKEQISNLLCFFAGICDYVEPLLDDLSNKIGAFTEENEVSDNSEKLSIMPNPNSGEFSLKVSQNCEIQSLELTNIEGKNINFQTISVESNNMKIKVPNAKTGIYLIKAKCIDGSSFVSRIVIE